jgi:Fur family peroxide stress response transcriptional regulator
MLNGDMAGILRASGQKVTPQRLAILTALRMADGHTTAAKLYEVVREATAGLDQSTVYRTLIAAEQAGLVARFSTSVDESEFEWVRDDHHHLVCESCGRLTTLDSAALENLVGLVMQSSDFLVTAKHLALKGRCGDCRSLTSP